MRVLVSYDISNDKNRRKVATIMEGHGFRVQYSVFECDISKAQLATLKRRLRPYVRRKDEDSVRFYPLPADALDHVSVIGVDLSQTLGNVTIV